MSLEIKDKKDEERSTLKKCFALFEVLIGKIISWFKYFVFNVKDPQQRDKMRNNMADRVTGFHDNCVHPNEQIIGMRSKHFGNGKQAKKTKSSKNLLKACLKKTTDIVIQTGDVRTQPNESFNASSTKVLPKNATFNTSNEARWAVAVGRNNNDHFDSQIQEMFCPGCISPQVMDEIKKDEIEWKNECIRRNTPSERKRKNDARQK